MKKRILFVNDEMTTGGVSKVLNNLLTFLGKEEYEVDLLILHYRGDMLKDIPSYVNVIKGSTFFDVCDIRIKELIQNHQYQKVIKKIMLFIYIKTGLIDYFVKAQRKKMGMKKYDTEIAFKEGFCSIFVANGDADNKINWVHADYKVKNYAGNYMNIMAKYFNQFDYNVAVSAVAAQSFEEIFRLNNKVRVIHNIINFNEIIEKSKVNVEYRDDTFSFITVGRFHPQKSYDRLVEAAQKLKQDHYQFKIYIVGDGTQKHDIENLIMKYGLENYCILLGSQSNPYKYLKQADCFVLSSLYEGMPTVVFESLILHIPVISMRVAGIEEQLQEKYGIVVDNDLNSLYKGMKEILDCPEILGQYREALKNYSYDNQSIIEEVKSII